MTLLTNHLRAVRRWAKAHDAHSSIEVDSFQMEVRARNRYFTLYPQFRARIDGKLVNVEQMSDHTTGFLGWLPYRPQRWPLSSDKLAFKEYARQHGLATPPWWPTTARPEVAFLLKPSAGSFGQDLSGPFPGGQQVPPPGVAEGGDDPARRRWFFERFIEGTNLKFWIWGRMVFHAHAAGYARVVGDGKARIEELIERLAAAQVPRVPRPAGDAQAIAACLAFQQRGCGDVLPAGESVWLDFRYGRGFEAPATTEQDDNALPRLAPEVLAQAREAAEVLARDLARQFPAPVLYSIDGVLDGGGKVWWLEVNSNPTLPPSGYSHVFSTLFGTQVH